jgi:RNA polymerase sporulation-specific sigma factor
MNFDEMSINEIVALAKTKNISAENYIIRKYKGVIQGRIKKKNYFLQGGDYEDLYQEGLIGLSKAIKDFDEACGDFEIFSKVCVERQLISAIKTSTRKKHTPLNDMIPLDRSLPDNENLTMMDIFGARDDVQFGLSFENLTPEAQFVLKETQEGQREMLNNSLSEKEKMVYYLYLEGDSYKEIMDILNVKNPKMIDNAIQRVRRKIEKIKNFESLTEQGIKRV